MALLFLALGCAAFVTAVAVNFGAAQAAIVTGFATAFYFTLNVLLGRKHDDEAASGLISRLFRVSWVTYAANVLVWVAAVGAATFPIVKEAYFAEFTVTVADEVQLPVAGAQVAFELDSWRHKGVTDGGGRVTILYPRQWGGNQGTLRVTERGGEQAQALARTGERFSDVSVGILSPTPRFRVTHLSLRGLAIDTVLRGSLSQELAEQFPRIVGVVRNGVWSQADEMLALYPRASLEGNVPSEMHIEVSRSGAEPNVTYSDSPAYRGMARALGGARQAVDTSVAFDFDFSNGILGCPISVPLGGEYRAILNEGNDFWRGDRVSLDDSARASLSSRSIRPTLDDDGLASISLVRSVDSGFLQQLLAAAVQADEINVRYLEFMVQHQVPEGLLQAEFSLTGEALCGGGPTSLSPSRVYLNFPAPVLRVTVIENISNDVLPISAIRSSVGRDRRIRPMGGRERTRTENVPWASGVLRPGEGIVVPRRLMLEGAMTAEEAANWRRAEAGATTLLSVFPRRPSDPINPIGARAFTLDVNQILPRGPRGPRSDRPLYVIGSTVQELTVVVNSVAIPTREDGGQTLAIFAGTEVGSCPYLFVSGQDGLALINRGQILRDQIGHSNERPDQVYIGRRLGRIEIRELEDETSHINSVQLVVRRRDGSEQSYRSDDTVLRNNDSRYVTLQRGETLPIQFQYTPRHDDVAFYLRVQGYYTRPTI